jgi:hypothetical protein
MLQHRLFIKAREERICFSVTRAACGDAHGACTGMTVEKLSPDYFIYAKDLYLFLAILSNPPQIAANMSGKFLVDS